LTALPSTALRAGNKSNMRTYFLLFLILTLTGCSQLGGFGDDRGYNFPLETVAEVEAYYRANSGPNENNEPFKFFKCEQLSVRANKENWSVSCNQGDRASFYILDRRGNMVKRDYFTTD